MICDKMIWWYDDICKYIWYGDMIICEPCRQGWFWRSVRVSNSGYWENVSSSFFGDSSFSFVFFSFQYNHWPGMLARNWRRRESRRGKERRWWSQRSRSYRRSTRDSSSTSPTPSRWRTRSASVILNSENALESCWNIDRELKGFNLVRW